MSEIRHPEVTVQLTRTDGNAFAVLGKVQRELRRAGVPDGEIEEIEEFMTQAMSGSYDNLLAVCMEWVEVL